MIGLISDIHANREALAVVLRELLAMDLEKIICLGDIVGYGPDPRWCVDAVRSSCEVVLCGNHEYGLIYGSTEFSDGADSTLTYHRNLLMPRPGQDSSQARRERWEFLKTLPHRHSENGRLFVHGSPRNPIREYMRERDCKYEMEKKLTENFALVDRLAFVGHTHRPGVITDEFEFLHPEQFDDLYECPEGRKAIINVGSVGQPRHGDTRACYGIIDGYRVTFRRVEYEVDKVARRIEQSGLDPRMAERLRRGR
jgi:diadenosine tetraphosphatase ApaH/serine/threonine PP2A family protein phosphatase